MNGNVTPLTLSKFPRTDEPPRTEERNYFDPLPDDLVKSIFQQCDYQTIHSLSKGSHRFRVLCQEEMTPRMAIWLINKNPHFYNSPMLGRVMKDRAVISAALAKNPELFDALPHELQEDVLVKKIAWVSALLNGKHSMLKRLFSVEDLQRLAPEFSYDIMDLQHPTESDWFKVDQLYPFLYSIDFFSEGLCYCSGRELEFASDLIKKDPVIVMAAVQQNGAALEYADPELRKDPAIVMAAVQSNGLALQSADPELKKDREIVMAAVRQDGRALEYADPEVLPFIRTS